MLCLFLTTDEGVICLQHLGPLLSNYHDLCIVSADDYWTLPILFKSSGKS